MLKEKHNVIYLTVDDEKAVGVYYEYIEFENEKELEELLKNRKYPNKGERFFNILEIISDDEE